MFKVACSFVSNLILVAFVSISVAEEENVLAPADTTSPRATLKSFIDACNYAGALIRKEHYINRSNANQHPALGKILDCLDLSELSDFERLDAGTEAAICIKEVIDRVDIPPEGEIPGLEEIENAPEKKPIKRWRIPGTRITIERIEDGPHRLEYLITKGTVSRARSYYKDMESLPYRKSGPKTTPGLYRFYLSAPGNQLVGVIVGSLPDVMKNRYQGLAWWQWVGLVMSVGLAFALMGVAYRLHGILAIKYREKNIFLYVLSLGFPVVAVLIPLFFNSFTYEYLTLRGIVLYYISFAANFIALLASLVLVFGAFNRGSAVFIASPSINPHGLDAQFIRILSKILSIVVATIVFLEGGRYLGIPLETLLASAGIGGLAVAMAAQDTIKNLFGTIMLLTDKPFRVKERIVFGKYDGVVEDIGLRSTRIRLLTGHQVSIPNSELANSDIENVSRRPFIRRSGMLEIPARTPAAKVKQAVEIVKAAISDHEGMDQERIPRVYLQEFNNASLGISFMYWYHPAEYWDYLELGEKINLEIIQKLEEAGIVFAAPAALMIHSDHSNHSSD